MELIQGLGSTEKVLSQRQGKKERVLRRRWQGEVTEAVKVQGG